MPHTSHTVTGLALVGVASPLREYFGTILDASGPWTEGMLEAHDDYMQRPGIYVWEGSCKAVTYHDISDVYDCTGYTFEGTWRSLNAEELDRIAAGARPLTGQPFPDRITDDEGRDVRPKVGG